MTTKQTGGDGDRVVRRQWTDSDPTLLTIIEHIRKRPSMYVGELGTGAVLRIIAEAVDNAVDHHLDGHASRLFVDTADDHFVVVDDGPGLPDEVVVPALSEQGPPLPHRRAPGLGLVILNALSRRLELDSHRAGQRRRWVFERGELVSAAEPVGACEDSGTTIRAWPDHGLLAACRPERDALRERLESLHVLLPELRVELDGRRFSGEGGLEAWVRRQPAWDGARVHGVEGRRGEARVELAWSWVPPYGNTRQLAFRDLRAAGEGAVLDGLLAAVAEREGVSTTIARARALAIVSVIDPGASLDDAALGDWLGDLVASS